MVQIDKKLSLKLSRLSFLCAMLVVAIHCSYRIDSFDELPRVFAWFQAVVNYGVTRIAVPLFFVMFGFLFFRDFDQSVKWWWRKLRKRTTSLVLPYLVWSLIGLAVLAGANQVRNTPIFLDVDNVKWWLQAVGVSTPPIGNYVLWFVREVILATLIAPLIGLSIRWCGLVIPLLLLALGILGMSFYGNLAYISFGAYLGMGGWRTLEKIAQTLERSVNTAMLGILWAALIIVVTFVKLGWIAAPLFLQSSLVCIMNICGMSFLWFGYNHIASEKILGFFDPVARSAFVVYVMHTLISPVIQYPMLHSSFAAAHPFAFCFVSYVVMVLAPILFWAFIERFAPRWMRQALAGGR